MNLRTCKGCGRTLPLDAENFEPARGKDSHARYFRRTCRACMREAKNRRYQDEMADPKRRARRRRLMSEYARQRRRANPEKTREEDRRRNQANYAKKLARWEADAKARAEDLAKRRIDTRLRRERQAGTLELAKPQPAIVEPYERIGSQRVPAEPLATWVAELHARLSNRQRFAPDPWTYGQTAVRCGVDEATVRRLLDGAYRSVGLPLADRMFCSAGHPEMLAILYPLDESEAA